MSTADEKMAEDPQEFRQRMELEGALEYLGFPPVYAYCTECSSHPGEGEHVHTRRGKEEWVEMLYGNEPMPLIVVIALLKQIEGALDDGITPKWVGWLPDHLIPPQYR